MQDLTRRSAVRPPSEIRHDIQGIRAIAVGVVVLYHLWPGRIPGGFVGVDMFFVVSGFLITGHIFRGTEKEPLGSFLRSFYARRIRRLAPAALLVLLVVSGAVALWMPMSAWGEEYSGVLASALFVENWHLGFQAVDYLASENAATAVQHFWSLSVEEQFYVFWPLLLVGSLALVRTKRKTVVLLVFLTLALFAASLWATAKHPDLAYFATPVRGWQFCVGALAVFVVLPPGKFAFWAPWVGAALLGASLFLITGEVNYPGLWALLPTLGTALVLLGRERDSRFSFGEVMSPRPIQWLGDISYSVYLWHWPLIVLLPFALGHELGTGWKVCVFLGSLLLGHLSFRWIETPVRRSTWLRSNRRTFLAGALSLIVVVTPATLALVHVSSVSRSAEAVLAEGSADLSKCFGALAIGDPNCTRVTPVSAEAAAAAKEDKPLPWGDGCADGLGKMSTALCEYGDANGKTQVLVWGDSHAGAWAPAFDRAGEIGGFSVSVAMRHGCPSAMTAPNGTSVGRVITDEEQSNCQARNDWVLTELVPNYDVVVLANMTTNYVFDGSSAEQFAGTIGAVGEAGPEAIVLQDVPLTGDANGNRVDGPDCLAQNQRCSNERSLALSADALAAEIDQMAVGAFRRIDTASQFCGPDSCDFGIGGVSVYFDASHISNSYSRSMGSWLAGELRIGEEEH